jgi:uncharacterized surface anchored protein
VDLDGTSASHPLARNELLAPGHWEISVPEGEYYVVSVRDSGQLATHMGAWWGFNAGTYTRLAIVLSSTPGTISGVVSTAGNPVAGAPILLQNETGTQVWAVRADPQGNYRIGGLAPGNYSVAAGFDLDMSGASATRQKATVSVAEGNTTTQALELVLP